MTCRPQSSWLDRLTYSRGDRFDGMPFWEDAGFFLRSVPSDRSRPQVTLSKTMSGLGWILVLQLAWLAFLAIGLMTQGGVRSSIWGPWFPIIGLAFSAAVTVAFLWWMGWTIRGIQAGASTMIGHAAAIGYAQIALTFFGAFPSGLLITWSWAGGNVAYIIFTHGLGLVGVGVAIAIIVLAHRMKNRAEGAAITEAMADPTISVRWPNAVFNRFPAGMPSHMGWALRVLAIVPLLYLSARIWIGFQFFQDVIPGGSDSINLIPMIVLTLIVAAIALPFHSETYSCWKAWVIDPMEARKRMTTVGAFAIALGLLGLIIGQVVGVTSIRTIAWVFEDWNSFMLALAPLSNLMLVAIGVLLVLPAKLAQSEEVSTGRP